MPRSCTLFSRSVVLSQIVCQHTRGLRICAQQVCNSCICSISAHCQQAVSQLFACTCWHACCWCIVNASGRVFCLGSCNVDLTPHINCMQAHRPAASLQVSRRECLFAFPAAANLKGTKTSRPSDRKANTETASVASCMACLI